MRILLCMFFIVFTWQDAAAERYAPESWYQKQWCEGRGIEGVRNPDGTWTDCLTETHAIEVDFANKWYEAVGQSLYYSLQTGKKAGIVLILESTKDRKYLIRLETLIFHEDLDIDVWEIGCGVPAGGENE